MQFLTVSAWFSMLQCTRELILLATGRTRALAIGQALRLLSLPPLLLAGFYFGGLTGMIVGFGTAEFIRYAFNVWLVRDLGVLGVYKGRRPFAAYCRHKPGGFPRRADPVAGGPPVRAVRP